MQVQVIAGGYAARSCACVSVCLFGEHAHSDFASLGGSSPARLLSYIFGALLSFQRVHTHVALLSGSSSARHPTLFAHAYTVHV